MNDQHSIMAMDAIAHAAEMVRRSWQDAAWEVVRPCVLLRPRLFIDGNKWCALYGENIQDGVAGFGDSPYEAMHNFDKNYNKKISE